MSFTVLYVPCPDQKTAKEIAAQLLAERRIACANISTGTSLYSWEGKTEEDTECYCLMKTQNWLAPSVERRVEELHPYKVPCVMKWEVSANKAYEEWIADCVMSNSKEKETNA